jgi:D-tyrosyl-tRNA(Tyr) deacylase
MRIIIQRVKKASVKIDKKIVGQIARGLLLFLGVGPFDKAQGEEKKLAQKILNLRIFGDRNDKMNLSVLDIKGEILLIPQFTLYADCSKGNRPYFGEAAKPEIAKPLFEKFVVELKKSGLKVEKGEFGAKMEVELVNDGPVTIILES